MERRLIIRLRIFFVVLILLLGAIIYEIGSGYILFAKVFFAFLIGAVSGIVFLRRKKIFWEEETSRVIARMDRIGTVLLAIYIAYAIFRHEWLAHLFYGHELTAFSLSLAAGAMAGRLFICAER